MSGSVTFTDRKKAVGKGLDACHGHYGMYSMDSQHWQCMWAHLSHLLADSDLVPTPRSRTELLAP